MNNDPHWLVSFIDLEQINNKWPNVPTPSIVPYYCASINVSSLNIPQCHAPPTPGSAAGGDLLPKLFSTFEPDY